METCTVCMVRIFCVQDKVELRSTLTSLLGFIIPPLTSGGAWDCSADLKRLSEADPERYPMRVMDFIGVSAFNLWFILIVLFLSFSRSLDVLFNLRRCFRFQQERPNGCFSCLKQGDEGWPCDLNNATCARM